MTLPVTLECDWADCHRAPLSGSTRCPPHESPRIIPAPGKPEAAGLRTEVERLVEDYSPAASRQWRSRLRTALECGCCATLDSEK